MVAWLLQISTVTIIRIGIKWIKLLENLKFSKWWPMLKNRIMSSLGDLL